jgi:hypothetical protein
VEYGPCARKLAKLGNHRIFIRIQFKIRTVHHLLGSSGASKRMFWSEMDHWVAPSQLGERLWHIMHCDGPDAARFREIHDAKLGVANANRILQH